MIPDARTAYMLTEDINSEANVIVLKEIEACINLAIKNGIYGVTLDRYISDPVMRKLQQLDYNVNRVSEQRDGIYTTISWQHCVINNSK